MGKMDTSDFDNKLNVFSPDGRLLQIEHAQKSSDQGTLISFCLNQEKAAIFFNLKYEDNLKIREKMVHLINKADDNTGQGSIFLSFSGLRPDSYRIIEHARYLCRVWAYSYGQEISISILAKKLATYIHTFTISSRFRPYGTKIVLFGKEDRMRSFVISCDGNSLEYRAGAIGNRETEAMKYLEEKYTEDLTDADLAKLAFSTIKDTAQNDPEKILGYVVGHDIEE